RGTRGTLPRDRGRACPTQGRTHRHVGDPSGHGVKEGDIGHPDRVRNCRGPGRQWPGRQPGATRRQRHGHFRAQDELAGKRVELLREIVPGLRRVAIIAYAGNPPSLVELEQAYAAARNFGLDAVKIEIRRMDEIASGLEPVTGNTEALYVVSHPLINANRIRISTLALGAWMATICGFREYVEVGALMSYGPNLPALFRRAGEFVDKILRGTKAAELPVEQPTKWDLVFNLTTARALGLAIPESFLLRADELIE